MPRTGPLAAPVDDVPTPDVFVARQPILTLDSEVVGYELLYRSALDPHLVDRNPRAATGHVLASTFFAIGLEQLVGTSRAWINFPRPWLIEGVIGALPGDRIVLEVHQSVEVDDELVEICSSLHSEGFTLALDHLVADDPRRALLPYASYGKVDIGEVDQALWPALVADIKSFDATPVALRVEDWLGLERAGQAGFELFQGYYLTKPNVIAGTEVPVLDSTRLLALQVAADANSTLEDVERVIEGDAGLAFRLLRYLNAASFGFRDPVSTIRQAVVRLGERGARTWLLLATIHAIGKGRPLELIAVSAIRARMCEQVATVAGRTDLQDEAFMAGLFLNIDAITGMPMADVLEAVTLPESVGNVLRAQPAGPVGDITSLSVAYAGGMWERVNELTETLGIDPGVVANEYVAAIDWARSALSF